MTSEKKRAYNRALYIRQREQRIAYNRKYCAEHRQDYRERTWAQRGISKPTRDRPLVCECCGRPPCGKNKTLHLDHNHDTGKFRGWLCFDCNTGIGKLGDDIEGLLIAVQYLARNP